MSATLLPDCPAAAVAAHAVTPVDVGTLEAAGALVADVRREGEPALRRHAVRLGDRGETEPLTLGPDELSRAWQGLPAPDRAVLERIGARVRAFAGAQRAALSDLEVPIPGGRAGHDFAPVERAGCYAPGGRFPLPSSVLMTAVTARAAGVGTVWVASPRPAPVTLAAAHLAGADGVLAVGGAQAIAALAFGAGDVPACDVVVGPGNRWVTAAKKLVAGEVRIDLLGGPSELVVIADEGDDPALVAADLLAQAEHDVDARAILISLAPGLAGQVRRELAVQLADLPTRETAAAALARGLAVTVGEPGEAAGLSDRLAPEHLLVLTGDPEGMAGRCRHYGALFLGALATPVLGDYGAGPNHVLPTGATARSHGGLSVLTFLRQRTWLQLDSADESLLGDAAALARMEGLEAHARALERRREGV